MPDELVVHCKRDSFDVYVGRPSIYGNMFSHKTGTIAKFKVSTLEDALEKYEQWILSQPGLIALVKRELKGKRLGCWCRPVGGFAGRLLCHGQILARIANE